VSPLSKRAFGGLLFLVVTLAASLFVAAWTLDYWQGWVFLAVFSGSALAITLYLMKTDPKLLERRVNAGPGAEKERTQNIIQILASIAFVVVIVIPALDHRFAWSVVPTTAVIAGDILIALGFLIVFRVFKENTFAAGTIDVEPEQRVISTGPYALVRHPMYSGALVMLAGVPLALGSLWGLLTIVPMAMVIVWRLLGEEEFLAKNLPGYSEYRNNVRYRLVPFIW
jgi:protein-S-isoprenylcysteine O-methyltransferase Ste14